MTETAQTSEVPTDETEAEGVLPALTADTLQQVELTLKFNVGTSKTTLGSLGSIQPGFVFETDTLLTQPVSIEVNGARLGRGELVAVGERLGIRVTEFRNDE